MVFVNQIGRLSAMRNSKEIRERFLACDRNTRWQLEDSIPFKFPTYHPQGLVVTENYVFLSSVEVTEPYSANAGSIWHIKTDISGVLNADSSLDEVIDLLHPTPAVCGYPKKKSRAFILENENYDRTFYSGFLGELNSSFASNSISSDLFVNLRSMQIRNSEAILYMGCGITKESIPEKEWEESVNKSMTMKRVLKRL